MNYSMYEQEASKFCNVSRETFDQLIAFSHLLTKWNSSINLIGQATTNDIWQRHILDSAQLCYYIPKDAKTITDFGSGGGLPGIILAILTDKDVHLVESDKRKCAFLTQAAAELALDNVQVHNTRIEDISPWASDVVTARALASVDQLCAWLQFFLVSCTVALFLKGESCEEEIQNAKKNWALEYEIFPSFVQDTGQILSITSIQSSRGTS